MGQYKVPQNVESEDKFIGPLSMKQFIYALIGLGWGFLMWRIFSIGGAAGIPFMFLTILPISGFMFLIAFGRREEQSFENYLIALIRFNVMPRKRLWMKYDVVDKAIVSTPKGPVMPAAPTESYAEVRSRLSQLALVVDTRGHAKSDTIQAADPSNAAAQFSQRVFTPDSLQHELVANKMEAQDDILSSAEGGAHADAVQGILRGVEQDIRSQAVEAMSDPNAASNTQNPDTVTPPQTTVNDAILKTVMNTGDLSVAQVAQAANRGQLAAGQTIQLR